MIHSYRFQRELDRILFQFTVFIVGEATGITLYHDRTFLSLNLKPDLIEEIRLRYMSNSNLSKNFKEKQSITKK